MLFVRGTEMQSQTPHVSPNGASSGEDLHINSHFYNSTLTVCMALPLPPGLTPPEIAFLCEMEMVTVIPRQRLEGLELLGVSCAQLV